MNFQDLIITSRVYLSSFDSDHYPENFRRFEEAAGPLFDALDGKDPALEAKQLIDELEKNRGTLPRSVSREVADMDKRILALFLAPAANRRENDEAAQAFLKSLNSQWNARYPRNTFLCGDYDIIMQGFDSTLFGLPLRKSKIWR